MSEVKENMEVNAEQKNTAQKDYQENYMPSVHKIGRTTMLIAFILSFVPVLYFVFIKGYAESLSSYINVFVAISSIGVGMWLTEPLAFWPVLGSAGTYVGYLSGNVGHVRFPVALNLQSAMDADINTPRGQVVTVIGIVASVFSNLVILIVTVIVGGWLVSVLPDIVIASFAFVTMGLMGAMLMLKWNGKEGVVKGFTESLPYLVLAIAVKLVIQFVFPVLNAWGMAIAVGSCLLLAYVMYKRDCKKDEMDLA